MQGLILNRRPGTLILAVMILANIAQAGEISSTHLVPPFTETDQGAWLNSAPLDWKQLRGKVVLLNVWTFGCSNCRRSIPWLQSVYAAYSQQDFEIIGIHSPEFAWEKSRLAVKKAVSRHGIRWPVMLDNGLEYWRALGNRYWPAYYLVDRQGNAAGYFIGETHLDDPRANAIEARIEKLLAQ